MSCIVVFFFLTVIKIGTQREIRYAYIKAVFFGAKNETFKFPHVRFIGIHNVCGQTFGPGKINEL